MNPPAPRLVRDRHGVRLIQHGVLISDLRTSPRPTHGLYDVLAALALRTPEAHPRQVALLGFGAGGILAPLKVAGWSGCLITVDTDRGGHDLFVRECPSWSTEVCWSQADAVEWLAGQRRRFGVLIEDLSIPRAGDIEKPESTWNRLPALIRDRLAPGGVAVFNLLKPTGRTWREGLDAVGGRFARKQLVHLDDYENRILVAGRALPDARTLSTSVRQTLDSMGSGQTRRFRVQTLS